MPSSYLIHKTRDKSKIPDQGNVYKSNILHYLKSNQLIGVIKIFLVSSFAIVLKNIDANELVRYEKSRKK